LHPELNEQEMAALKETAALMKQNIDSLVMP